MHRKSRIRPSIDLTPGNAIGAGLFIGITAWCWLLTQWHLW
jgi:hypothetical protein